MTPQRLRIAIVTSIHHDFDGRVWRHARSLAEVGYRVHLICPWAVKNGEVKEGVELRPFPRVAGRLLRPFVILRIARRLLPILRQVDVVHFHDLDLLPWMALLSLARPVVYDVHENYPDEMLEKDWIPQLLRRPAYHVVRIAEEMLSKIIRNCVLVVPAQDPRFRSRRLRVIHVRNYATRHLAEGVRDDYFFRKDTVVFTGTHHEGRGSLLLLDIADRARARGLDLTFLITSRFSSDAFRGRFMAEIDRRQLGDRVFIRPHVAAHDIMNLLNEATVAIAPNLRHPTQEKAIHTKLFEYMAAGLPIVATDLPHEVEFIGEANAGFLAKPEDPNTFVQALADLVGDRHRAYQLGLNGRRAFFEKYCWESQIPALMQFYDDIVRRNGTSTAISGAACRSA